MLIASDRPIEWVDSERYNHHPVPAHLRINYQIWIATFAIGRAFVLTLPFTLFIVFPIDFRLPISSFLCFKFFHLPNLVQNFLYIKHDLSYQKRRFLQPPTLSLLSWRLRTAFLYRIYLPPTPKLPV